MTDLLVQIVPVLTWGTLAAVGVMFVGVGVESVAPQLYQWTRIINRRKRRARRACWIRARLAVVRYWLGVGWAGRDRWHGEGW